MKSISFLITAMVLSSTCNGVYGQKTFSDQATSLKYAYALADNKQHGKPNLPIDLTSAKIDMKALRHFGKKYSSVENEQWEVLEEGEIVNDEYLNNVIRYVVRFTKDSKKTMIAYDRKGGVIHTIFTYSEHFLPKDERHIVRSTYYDYKIISVQELHIAKLRYIIYLVNIEDENQILHLRVAENELQVIDTFDKDGNR